MEKDLTWIRKSCLRAVTSEKNSLFIFPVNEEKSTKNCIVSFFSFLLLFIELTLTDIRRRILDCKYAKTTVRVIRIR